MRVTEKIRSGISFGKGEFRQKGNRRIMERTIRSGISFGTR